MFKITSYSILFLFFCACNSAEQDIVRKKQLLFPFLNGSKIGLFAWSPTSTSLSEDQKRGAFVERANFDHEYIQFNSDSTFIFEKMVDENRPNHISYSELITRKGTYRIIQDKIVLNQPIYLPEKAYDGLCFEQYSDTIYFNEQYKCLTLINNTMSPYNFQVYLGIEAALKNATFSDSDRLNYAIKLLNRNEISDIININSYQHHFK
jgi:hypothetical protein